MRVREEGGEGPSSGEGKEEEGGGLPRVRGHTISLPRSLPVFMSSNTSSDI